jgi:cytochrome c6
MDKRLNVAAGGIILAAMFLAGRTFAAPDGEDYGRSKFEEHCAECHPEGGNSVTPAKTLRRKDREANGVKSAGDIIARMRNPGPGMTRFGKEAISDRDAGAIADYIIRTFR